MEKINQGLGGESSELIEGRKDKRNIGGEKSNVNENGESKLDLSDTLRCSQCYSEATHQIFC